LKKDGFSMKRLEELPTHKAKGQSALHIIGSAIDAEYMAMSIAIMKPGERILKHNHKEAEEIYVLSKGKSTIIGGDKKVHVEATTFFRFPPKTQREIINDSDEDATWIFIGAPINEYLEGYTHTSPAKKNNK
jgi:mannose-6-phosphate isomerase-like protein (cupin superfamily)